MPINTNDVLPLEDFTSKLIDTEPSFLVSLQDFTDPDSNLERLAKRPQLVKELIQQMKHSQQEFLQTEQDFTKLLDNTGKNCFRDNVYIYRFYFLTSLVVILVSIILIILIGDHVRHKAFVTQLTICKMA